MREVQICPCCGRKIVKYKHKLNFVLIRGLAALKNAGGTATLKELKLDVSANNNFQKLKYFGLVEKLDGSTIYQLTEAGELFLLGKSRAPEEVYTVDGNVVEIGESISINEVEVPVQYREEWEYQASLW